MIKRENKISIVNHRYGWFTVDVRSLDAAHAAQGALTISNSEEAIHTLYQLEWIQLQSVLGVAPWHSESQLLQSFQVDVTVVILAVMLSGYESTAIVFFSSNNWENIFSSSSICLLISSIMEFGTFMHYWANTSLVPLCSFVALSIAIWVSVGALLMWARWVEINFTVDVLVYLSILLFIYVTLFTFVSPFITPKKWRGTGILSNFFEFSFRHL